MRHRSPSAKIDKAGPARGSFVNKAQAENPEPGSYRKGYEFGENVKGYGFGKPQTQKTEIDNRDYGYDPDREFKNTRNRSPNTIINQGSPSRPKTYALEQSAGPG